MLPLLLARRTARVRNVRDVQRRSLHTITNQHRQPRSAVTVTNGRWGGGGQVREYSGASDWFTNWLWSQETTAPEAPVAEIEAEPAAATTSSATTVFVGAAARTAGTESAEVNWEGIGQGGTRHQPGPFAVLHRSDNTPPDTLFKVGLPVLPGTNYNLKSHQERSGGREGTDDALYGATDAAKWGDDEGPLFESGGRYLLVLEDVWGVIVESQQRGQSFDIIEMEVAFRTAPAHKIICVLDKTNGQVIPNPALPKEQTAPQADRLHRLYMYGVRKGALPI